jgi:hypothetical protein
MRGKLFTILVCAGTVAAFRPALAGEPIILREMGSFHVGGRVVEISGKPLKEVVFSAGGVPAKIDPNGLYQVEQMYVQYFLLQDRKGKYPLLMWHGGGLTGVTYESTPDGRGRAGSMPSSAKDGTSTTPMPSSADAQALLRLTYGMASRIS